MTSNPPVRVAIVNDYELVVAGLASVLAPYADRVTIVEVDSNVAVLSEVDLVLCDSYGRLGGDFDPDLASGTSRLVVFSWDQGDDAVRRAFDKGASGFVSKGVSAEELVEALVDVHRGRKVVLTGPEEVMEQHEDGMPGRWPGDDVGLTLRESEVLALICQGISNEEIGRRAFIGVNTVKTHIRTLYRKIGATSRSQAVIWGLTHGFEQTVARRVGSDVDRMQGRTSTKP